MCSLQLYSVSTQLQNKYSRSGISCLLKEEEDSWGSTEEENRYCLQAKRELYQLIEEVSTQQELEVRGERVFRPSSLEICILQMKKPSPKGFK